MATVNGSDGVVGDSGGVNMWVVGAARKEQKWWSG